MINLISLSFDTTIECSLDELPDLLVEKTRLHLPKEEKIYSCTVTKQFDTVWAQIITAHRVVSTSLRIEKGEMIFKAENKSESMLLSGFSGFSHDQSGKPIRYDLEIISPSINIVLKFFDKEIFQKTGKLVLSLANKTN